MPHPFPGWGWSRACSFVSAVPRMGLQSCLVELPRYTRSSRHAVLCGTCQGQPLQKEWDSGLGQVSLGAECVPAKDPSPVPISLAALCQYEVVHHPLVTGPRYFPLEALCDMQLYESPSTSTPLVLGGGPRPTGTQSSCRSRRTRRRRNRTARPLKAREPLDSAIVAWNTTTPHEKTDKWGQLAGLVSRGFQQGFLSVESSMVGLFEDDEPTDPLTLEYLVVHKMFQALASPSPNPSDWVFVLRGSEDLSANSCEAKPRNLKVCSANVTRWRSSHRKWAHTLSPDILMLQELHLTKEDLKSETRHLMNLGFVLFGVASPKSAKGNPLAGVGIAVKNHLGPRILVTFHASQGCGYVIVALRSKGVDFNWISLYLESGTGLDSPVNDLILSSLTQHLSLLQGMWVVGGDSNVLIQDFLNSRYEERWQGRVVGSGSPTAGGDSEIDFFVVHPSLQSLSTVRLSFDTPFKPHGLLTLDVPVHSLQLRVPTIRSVP